MKQNKKYLAIIPIVALIISILCVPVSAATDQIRWASDISAGLLPVSDSSSVRQNGVFLANRSGGYWLIASSVSGMYVAIINGTNYIVGYSDNTTPFYTCDDNGGQLSTLYCNNYDETTGLYYFNANTYFSRGMNENLPNYSNINSALSSMSTVIDDSSSSTGSCAVIPTSYTSITSDRWIKASISDVSGMAYYFDGEYYNLVVANINANNYINMATENSQSPVGLYQITVIDSVTVYYNDNVTRVSESDTSELGYFTSVSDAVSAIYNMLDEGGAIPTAPAQNALNLNLNPGNVAYIDITGTANNYANITVNLTGAAYYTISDFQARMNYMYGFSNTIPSSFSLPITGTSSIRWEPNGKPTVTGTYNSFKASIPYNASEGNYLIIVNPVYENIDVNSTTIFDINAYNVNNVLNIQCVCNNYYIYSLSVAISYSDGQSHYESGESTTQYIGTYNPITQQWETINAATGEPGTPSYGGDVQQPEFTVEQEAKKFTSWLKEFLQGFISIFDAGKSSITTLVGYATPFFTAIASLYSWLPAPVYTVLISGLSLVITVGIIKVFL